MSLLLLAIEYLMFHTVFETIRDTDNERVNIQKSSTKSSIYSNSKLQELSEWTPLSDNKIQQIRNIINER